MAATRCRLTTCIATSALSRVSRHVAWVTCLRERSHAPPSAALARCTTAHEQVGSPCRKHDRAYARCPCAEPSDPRPWRAASIVGARHVAAHHAPRRHATSEARSHQTREAASQSSLCACDAATRPLKFARRMTRLLLIGASTPQCAIEWSYLRAFALIVDVTCSIRA